LETINEFSGYIYNLKYSPDDTFLAISVGNSVQVWNNLTKSVQYTFNTTKPNLEIEFSSNNTYLAAGGMDAVVRVWNLEDGTQIYLLKGHSDSVTSVAFSRDSTLLVSTSWDKNVFFWDMSSGKILDTLSLGAVTVDFSPDGEFIAFTQPGPIGIWGVSP
jgi:WD40 repeat protein